MLEVAQMATQHSPHTPASHRGLGHTRIPSIRKPSLSSPASTSVSSNSSTGIPSFRSIRSLLPFGPNKHATTVSASVSPAGSNGSSSRSPFPLFGSARRSMTRERQASLSSLSPVIAIEKPREEEPQIRRSFSLTALEKPLPDEPHLFSVSGDDFDESTEARAPSLPPPSPGSPFLADLSTIIEADTSGISKYLPSASRSPSPSPSPRNPNFLHPSSIPRTPESENTELNGNSENDNSALDLSTTRLTVEVLDALIAKDYASAGGWNADIKVVDVDTDADHSAVLDDAYDRKDISFNLDALDPELAALLSPHRIPPANSNNTIVAPLRRSIDLNQASPFPSPAVSPSPSPNPNSPSEPHSPQRISLLARRSNQSSLPRLRPIASRNPSSTNSASPSSELGESASGSHISNLRRAPPSPLSNARPSTSPESSSSNLTLERRGPPPSSSRQFTLGKYAASRVFTSPSLTEDDSRRGQNDFTFTSSTSRLLPPSSSRSGIGSPTRSSFDVTYRGSASPEPSEYRARPSLDIDRMQRPHLPTSTSTPAASALNRQRKRSMSMEDHRSPTMTRSYSYSHTLSSRHMLRSRDGADSANGSGGAAEGIARPSSSLSTASSRAPLTEWLGPRTAKAFRAAGLLDFEPGQTPSPDAGIRSPSSGAGGVHSGGGRNWSGSMRGTPTPSSNASDYGGGGRHSRTQSRMAYSEAGSVASVVGRKRGSGSFSHGHTTALGYEYGQSPSSVIGSPTFTLSSRDTPRSASTAPTSVSNASWREREREETKDLKEKHATETGALLGALSDSQRTTRMLREENADLRERLAMLEGELEKMGGDYERLAAVETENGMLRRLVNELRGEVGEMKMQLRIRGTEPKRSSALRYTTSHFAPSSEDQSSSSHEESRLAPSAPSTSNPSSFVPTDQQRRRFSGTSSIFPMPPTNMSLLMHEDSINHGSDRSGYSESPSSPTIAIPLSMRRGHAPNRSVASATSISPTTANFSMNTGSPGSLFLRPEHELHLGDMDSLDLGRRDVASDGDDQSEDF